MNKKLIQRWLIQLSLDAALWALIILGFIMQINDYLTNVAFFVFGLISLIAVIVFLMASTELVDIKEGKKSHEELKILVRRHNLRLFQYGLYSILAESVVIASAGYFFLAILYLVTSIFTAGLFALINAEATKQLERDD